MSIFDNMNEDINKFFKQTTNFINKQKEHKMMKQKDMILLHTIAGFLLANKEINLADALYDFIKRQYEEPEEKEKPQPEEKIQIVKNYKTAQFKKVPVQEENIANTSIKPEKKPYRIKGPRLFQKLNGEIVKIWICPKEAQETMGYNVTNICQAIRKGGRAYGYDWEYEKK